MTEIALGSRAKRRPRAMRVELLTSKKVWRFWSGTHARSSKQVPLLVTFGLVFAGGAKDEQSQCFDGAAFGGGKRSCAAIAARQLWAARPALRARGERGRRAGRERRHSGRRESSAPCACWAEHQGPTSGGLSGARYLKLVRNDTTGRVLGLARPKPMGARRERETKRHSGRGSSRSKGLFCVYS